jgi:quinol monooxygenase YgiN
VGCISFDTLEDVTHPNTFVVLGEWNDEVSLDQHEQSEHVAAFKANAGSMIAARQPARVYIIQRATGLNASNISSISS